RADHERERAIGHLPIELHEMIEQTGGGPLALFLRHRLPRADRRSARFEEEMLAGGRPPDNQWWAIEGRRGDQTRRGGVEWQKASSDSRMPLASMPWRS